MDAAPLIDAVVEAVYREVSVWVSAADTTIPERVARVHQALCLFLERNERDPFVSPEDAIGWTWATFGNLGRWQKPPDASLEALGGFEPISRRESASVESPSGRAVGSASLDLEDHLDADTHSSRAAEVILRYYSSASAPHTGRLSLTQEEVQVVRAVAEFALNDGDYRVSTDAYALISAQLDASTPRVKKVFYEAKQAFVRVYYVVGALGTDGALSSVGALDMAVRNFRTRFRGQNDWSILAWAARSALPAGDHAYVDARAYDRSIEQTAEQAGRLGWTEGGPRPSELLHRVELEAAKAFDQPRPRCVLSHSSRCAVCDRGREGGQR